MTELLDRGTDRLFSPALIFANTNELTREVLGNIPGNSQTVFFALSFIAALVFGWGIYRRARLWRLGAAEEGRLPLQTVLINLVHNVLLQKRVLGRGTISLAHILLFSGFMVLFLGTVLLAVEHGLAVALGRTADEPVFHKGIYYAVYELVMDTFGRALLAGCVMFAGRRIKHPASLGHNWQDWCVLAAFIVLGVSGYVLEGLRIIREQTPWPGFSYVGWLSARAFEAA